MHEGHRQRMYAKLENSNTLYDHEILEILLFTACPRVNTNPIAHALIDRFGSLKNVFNACVDELKTVNGVGESLAYFLKVVGECLTRTTKTDGTVMLTNGGDCKKYVTMRFYGKTEEALEFYYLEKNGKVKRTVSYTSDDRNKVSADARLILSDIALIKPYGLIVAHNHLNASSNPSGNDDYFTSQMQTLCRMNNIRLIDHLIYASDDDIFSYKDADALDNNGKFSYKDLAEWKTSLL